ncbi:LemA family protein [Hyella patelloides LEGE 07179]|uniref:LemA family protein n=1 Tax=Hyella patelloides LEGE 07179 TaxID=945734 RepID=A0A563W224_9CYAN|nr:LemA family protein [Hyella patelloides]VEP17731.1 LemA family protein [Hyella patelloides LEGE 07179]
MKQPNNSFSEAKASEILELAARYYTEENQAYTDEELIHAGTEAQIPDYLVIKAVQEIKNRKQQKLARKKRIQYRLKRVLGSSLLVFSAIACWGTITYNHLITVISNTKTAQKQVTNQLQRRANLIPQLVNLTQTYANHEQEIITQLIVARQDYLKADAFEAKTNAIANIDRAILNFSNYATTNQKLKSSQLFINLQYEITGTENRLAVERMRYNQAVEKYNQEIKQFPQSLVATIFQFESL